MAHNPKFGNPSKFTFKIGPDFLLFKQTDLEFNVLYIKASFSKSLWFKSMYLLALNIGMLLLVSKPESLSKRKAVADSSASKIIS